MRIRGKVKAIFALLLVSSCATVNVKQDGFLISNKHEGYLLATVQIDRPGWQVTIFPRNSRADYGSFSQAVAVFDRLKVGRDLIFIKLPAGEYTFKYVYKKPFAFEMKDCIFKIAENTICYVGDLEIHVTNNSSIFPAFEYRYVDSFGDSSDALKASYPMIASKYQIINNFLDSFSRDFLQPIRRM